MQEIDKFATENVNKLLIGNKCDLEEDRQVSYDEGMELAKNYDVPFLEVSAKNSTNIDQCFTLMATEIHERFL
jgi:Ras-related protein Rab-1A